MRVALVHDWLNQMGGAERMLLAMTRMFPDAPIYTSIYDPARVDPAFRSLDIRELEPAERESFENSWVDVQRGFVDNPVQSVRRADALVVDIMRTRGYPVDDFDRQAEDISVEHPQVVQHFRDARATRVATDEGAVDTERQRQAVTSYRALIEALLHGESHQNTTATTTEERTR